MKRREAKAASVQQGKFDMELPKRKDVRLKNYDYSANGAYYVTVCTHNRAKLFGTIVGATLRGRPNRPDKMIEKWVLELENKFDNLKIDKYIIMPDHIHLLISVSDNLTGDHTGSPLPFVIDWFKTMTTNEYIRGVKNGIYPPFDKHIWQRNYFEHVVRCEQDYEEIWRYIEENPLKHYLRITNNL